MAHAQFFFQSAEAMGKRAAASGGPTAAAKAKAARVEQADATTNPTELFNGWLLLGGRFDASKRWPSSRSLASGEN